VISGCCDFVWLFRWMITQSHRNHKVSHELQSWNVGIWEFPLQILRENYPATQMVAPRHLGVGERISWVMHVEMGWLVYLLFQHNPLSRWHNWGPAHTKPIEWQQWQCMIQVAWRFPAAMMDYCHQLEGFQSKLGQWMGLGWLKKDKMWPTINVSILDDWITLIISLCVE